jgi:hypothetical protein
MWVHCPRASNGLLPRRSDLVGYVQWDARFDQVLLVKQSSPTALQVAVLQADLAGLIRTVKPGYIPVGRLRISHLPE